MQTPTHDSRLLMPPLAAVQAGFLNTTPTRETHLQRLPMLELKDTIAFATPPITLIFVRNPNTFKTPP